jgi:hypothetical protein
VDYTLHIEHNQHTSMGSTGPARVTWAYDLVANVTFANGDKQRIDFLLSRGRLIEPRQRLKADIESRSTYEALRRIARGLPYAERPAFYKRIKAERGSK